MSSADRYHAVLRSFFCLSCRAVSALIFYVIPLGCILFITEPPRKPTVSKSMYLQIVTLDSNRVQGDLEGALGSSALRRETNHKIPVYMENSDTHLTSYLIK